VRWEEGPLDELTRRAGRADRRSSTASAGGDIVLDPFLGSGSTLMTAGRTGRIWRSVEIDPTYVAAAIRR